MARTTVLTKNQILEASKIIVNDNGFHGLTIRQLAKTLGTSTAPIYTQFKNMDMLLEALKIYVLQDLYKNLEKQYTTNGFLNIGVGLINFVLTNQKVYTHYFLNQSTLIEDIRVASKGFISRMKEDPILALLDDNHLCSLMDDMVIYTFGLSINACNTATMNPLEYYIDKLEQTGNKLINYHILSSGQFEKAMSIIASKGHSHCKKEGEIYEETTHY